MTDKATKLERQPHDHAGFLVRLAAIVYDWFLLAAVLFVATALLLPLNSGKAFTPDQYFYPLYLIVISFVFYGWFWTNGGQTLGLRAWNLKVQTFEGLNPSWSSAAIRFFGALFSWLCLGLGFIWMLFNKNRYTWYDSWSNTKVSYLKATPKK